MTPVGAAWHDAASRSLDAMEERAKKAEAERDVYREALEQLASPNRHPRKPAEHREALGQAIYLAQQTLARFSHWPEEKV